MSKPNGQRVAELLLRDADGTFNPVDPAKIYKLATIAFLVSGGDGYSMIPELMVNHYYQGKSMSYALTPTDPSFLSETRSR